MIYILDLVNFYRRDKNRKTYFLLFPYDIPGSVQNPENLVLTYRKSHRDDSSYEIRYTNKTGDPFWDYETPRHLRNYWIPEYDENTIYELLVYLDLKGEQYKMLEVRYKK